LDAKGEGLTSEEFSSKIQGFMLKGVKRVVFAVGGAYGFSNQVYDRSNQMISLSPMTFSHQMVRLVFVEQLYRAFTIIKGEPYHHK
jgi:23S rRNA (pseudouridine1915-N3)-methyltransferase